MVFSKRYIDNLYSAVTANCYSVLQSPSLGTENMNPYRVIVEANIKKEVDIEIPTVLKASLDYLPRNIAGEILQKKHRIGIAVPLNSRNNIVSGNNTLIKELFSLLTLSKVSCKDQIYYGCKGIAFDSYMKMLLMINKCYKVENFKLVPTKKIIVHVSPKVFIDRSSTLEKHIINRVILAFLSEDNYYGFQYEVEVKIDDAKEFIRAVHPPQDRDMNEALNNLLEDNVNSLLLKR